MVSYNVIYDRVGTSDNSPLIREAAYDIATINGLLIYWS